MINIRKILLLSALLMSAASITAPTYATDDEGDVVQSARVRYAEVPPQLTPDMIQDIRQHGSFLASTKEYVLQNPNKLDIFESYYLKCGQYYPVSRNQSSYMDDTGLNYYIQETGVAHRLNPNYDPKRPEETGPQWIVAEHDEKLARLIFQEQDRAFVPEPVATTSMQVPLSGQSPLTDYRSIAAEINS